MLIFISISILIAPLLGAILIRRLQIPLKIYPYNFLFWGIVPFWSLLQDGALTIRTSSEYQTVILFIITRSILTGLDVNCFEQNRQKNNKNVNSMPLVDLFLSFGFSIPTALCMTDAFSAAFLFIPLGISNLVLGISWNRIK